MTKIVLDDIVSTQNVQKINANFDKIAEELNTKALSRKPEGEPNFLDDNLDLNGYRILNSGAPVAPTDLMRKADVEKLITDGIVIVENTEGVNLGGGLGIYVDKVGKDLRFKSLIAGTNVTLSEDGSSITINTSNPEEGSNTLSVASLKLLPATPKLNTVYDVISLASNGTTGGGHYIWNPTTNKTSHDGSSVIAPEAIAAWDGTTTNLLQLESWTGTGTGCWLLIGSMLSPSALGMEGRTNLSQLPETNFYITNNVGVTDLPTGWLQGRYHLQQIGRTKDSHCTQILTDVGAFGTNGGAVCRQAVRRMRNVGIWSDWFEIVNTNSALYKELTPNVSNIAALKLRAGAFDNQRVFVSEYNAGTDVGGGSFIWNSASTATADDVTIFQVTSVATGRWVRQYEVLTVEMAGAVAGVSDTPAIQRAVDVALFLGSELNWPDGTYLKNANVTNFHSVKHTGKGKLQTGTGGPIWYITPEGVEQNILNVSPSGTVTNDGLTDGNATTIAQAITVLKAVGNKAFDGKWRIQLTAGTHTFNGLRMDDMPLFRNPLEVWGADVALTSTPATIWDGTTSTTPYAMRQDGGVAAVANWHFKNIKFINWMYGSGNSGAILVWAQGNVLCENIHCDNMGTGLWFRHGSVKITHGRIENVDTYGIGVQYGASGNVGDLSGGGVYIRGRTGGSALGVAVGRNTTCYIQGCNIDNTNTHINVTRVSRIRTQGNTYGANFNVACVWNDTNSVWTPDNNSGSPDIYPTLTEAKPAYRCEMGAVHQLIDRLGQRSLHACSDGAIATITTTPQTLLSSLNASMTPFRLPKWFLYSPTFKLEVEIGVNIASGGGGTLTLNGEGNTSSSQLALLTIPNVGATTKGIIKISVVQSAGVSTARYSVEFKAGNILSEMNSTANLNTSTLRTNAEDDLVYRLYWTSNNTNQVEFFNMRTYVEI